MGGGGDTAPPQQRVGSGLGPAGRGLTRARVAVSATFASDHHFRLRHFRTRGAAELNQEINTCCVIEYFLYYVHDYYTIP